MSKFHFINTDCGQSNISTQQVFDKAIFGFLCMMDKKASSTLCSPSWLVINLAQNRISHYHVPLAYTTRWCHLQIFTFVTILGSTFHLAGDTELQAPYFAVFKII